MTNRFCIPDLETRSKSVNKWREACRKLDLVTVKFDELIAIIETDLGTQNALKEHLREPVLKDVINAF